MTDERGFQSAAERRAVDRRDDRHGRRLDRVEHGIEIGTPRGLAAFADIGPGDEGAAVAAQHDRLDAVIGARGLEMPLESPATVPGHRVAGRLGDCSTAAVPVLLAGAADGVLLGEWTT